METNKAIEYIAGGIFWLSNAALVYVTVGLGLSWLQGTGKKIVSRKELETTVEEEALRLSLDPSKIDILYWSERDAARMKDDRYELYLRGPTTRSTIRHELYHIKKDCDKKLTNLRYFLIAEPRATLYGLFKLRF